MGRGMGRCLWLDRSCDEGEACWSRAATLAATKDMCLLALLFCGRFLQAGKPPAPSGPAARACMPGTAARQIRGEGDWLCLENWVVGWESWQRCKFMRGRRNTEGAERWKSSVEVARSRSEVLWLCRRRLWVQCHPFSRCPCMPSEGDTCTKRSLQSSLGREKKDPVDVQTRGGFRCQHIRQGSGAPAGQGGAEVSWCVHASPGRHSASLTLLLSEKSESTHYRSDILSSISSPCVASGQAHVLSRRTLNICHACCQLPATPCPSVQTACKCISLQSSGTG